jgi:hypothetical protein
LARIQAGKQIGDLKGPEKLGYIPKSGYIDRRGKVIRQPTN